MGGEQVSDITKRTITVNGIIDLLVQHDEAERAVILDAFRFVWMTWSCAGDAQPATVIDYTPFPQGPAAR